MKRKFYLTTGALVLTAALALTGCSSSDGTTAALSSTSGSSGGTTGGTTGGTSASTTLSGVASDGPLSGATVTAYKITNGAKGAELSTTTTAADGTYSLGFDYAGPVLVEVDGGTYTDEATGQTVTLGTSLQAVTTATATAGTYKVAVTPLTDLAEQLASASTGGLNSTNIVAANNEVSNLIQTDVVSTQPVDVTNAAKYAAGTAGQQKYALMLATISEYAKDDTQSGSITDAVSAIKTDLSTNQMLQDTGSDLLTAENTFLGTAQNGTGQTTASDTTLYNAVAGATSTTVTTTQQVYAMKVAEKVSVVEAKAASASTSASAVIVPMKIATMKAAVAPSTLPLDSDYYQDKASVYVDDNTTQAFDMVNQILCMMGQTDYDQMLNKGDYRAQIDMSQCQSKSGQSGQNQSSGANMPQYDNWTVNSSRADNSSPQIVEAWVHQKAQGQGDVDKLIKAKTTITEGKSDTNPYGLFTIDFVGYPVTNGTADTSTTLFKGLLKTEKNAAGQVVFQFVEQDSFPDQNGQVQTTTQATTFTRAADGSTGSGTIEFTPDGATTPKVYDFAYDGTYFFRSDGTNSGCLDRTQFTDIAYQYGLYGDDDSTSATTAPGARVSLDSGFPISYTDPTGTTYYGNIGYYGLWMPDEAGLTASYVQSKGGVQVTKQDFGSTTTPANYTLDIYGGKLIRHTRKTLTLADIKGINLQYNPPPDPTSTSTSTPPQYQVAWDGTGFKYVSYLTDPTNWTWSSVPADDPTGKVGTYLDLTALQMPELDLWSDSLNGQVRIQFGDPSNPSSQCVQSQPAAGSMTPPTFDCSNNLSSAQVVFYSQETVYPGDSNIPTSLYCFENCPDPSQFTSTTSSPFFNTDYSQMSLSGAPATAVPTAVATGTAYEYTYDSSYVLKLNSQAVVATGSSSGQNQYGIDSGAMVDANDATALAALACDSTDTTTCLWQAWNLPTFYTWETGPNQWNQLAVLWDDNNGGGPVPSGGFAPPLNVTYTVPSTLPAGFPSDIYPGTKFQLQYQGFGNLSGIPGICTDDSGNVVDCGPNTKWMPEFSIPDGSQVTDANGTTYVVKALQMGEKMQPSNSADLSDVSACTNAGLTTSTQTLPDISTWVDPAIGTEPTDVGAPAVIGGVLQ